VDELVRRLFALDVDLIRDPYPLHKRLREESPVHFVDAKVALVAPHALANTVFRDGDRFHASPTRAKGFEGAYARLSSEEQEMVRRMYEHESHRLTNTHGERHRRIRSAASRYFTPKKVRELTGRVEDIVEQELAALAEGADDGVADICVFANRVPLLVIMEMIGAPYEDADMVRGWGDARSAINSGGQYDPAARVALSAASRCSTPPRPTSSARRSSSRSTSCSCSPATRRPAT
jgi:cytochrome P450